MKNYIKMFLAACMITGSAFSLNAQSVGINADGSVPNSSAGLDVNFTNKGFLPPRMTYAEQSSITNPAAGLIIWCNNCGAAGELQVYNGTSWTNMIGGTASEVFAIGDSYGRGKIAYILQPGDPGYVSDQIHGLIAADADQNTNAAWGCPGTTISGADGTALGTGNQNTLDIVAGCSTEGIAARICNDLVLNGYSDWYLPSKDELHKLFINKAAIGGFAVNYYWSSSESNDNAWTHLFNFDAQFAFPKDSQSVHVRAVRAF